MILAAPIMSGCFSKPLSSFSPNELLLMKGVINEQLFIVGIGEYSGGKIYRIVQIDRYVLVYVGSTVQELLVRFAGHMSFIKSFLSSKLSQYIYENGGPENFRIELVMRYPCRSKAELEQKEGYFIHLMKPLCNTNVPGQHGVLRKAIPISRRCVHKLLNSHERVYSAVAAIDLQQAKKIVDKQALRTASPLESLQLQKFWIDTHIKQPDCESSDTARVFDNLTTLSRVEILLNIATIRYADKNVFQSINPFGDLDLDMDKRLKSSQVLRAICQLLNLSSTHDIIQRIPEKTFQDNEDQLQKLVDELFQMHPDVSSTSSTKSTTKRLHLNINKLFGTFTGSKLRSKHSGKRMDKITYFIEVSDDFAADVFHITSESLMNECVT